MPANKVTLTSTSHEQLATRNLCDRWSNHLDNGKVEHSPPPQRVAPTFRSCYNQYEAEEEYIQSRQPGQEMTKSGVTLGAAWATSNPVPGQQILSSCTQSEMESHAEVLSLQGQEGYAANIHQQWFIPSFYSPVSTDLLMPVVPHVGLDSEVLERNVIAEQLLHAQPEYYDD